MRYLASLLVIGLVTACGQEGPAPVPVESPSQDTIESSRDATVVVLDRREGNNAREVLDAFQSETGNSYQLITGDDISAAGESDLKIFGSLADLWDLAEADGFRPIFSAELEANIPAVLRDSELRWAGLTMRPRVVFFREGTISEAELASLYDYAGLGQEQWQGRLCISSSRIAGNRGLVAFLIRRLGVRSAELVVRNWRANLAVEPFADEFELIQSVVDGQCQIGIADWHHLREFVGRRRDASLEPHLFNETGEVFVDVSGAGVSRHATRPDAAIALLEWLTGRDANALFAAQSNEFPANADSPASRAVLEWTDSRDLPEPLSELGFLIEEADRLIERARYP